MMCSMAIRIEKGVNIKDLRKAVEILPDGGIEYNWGWSCDVDIIKPPSKNSGFWIEGDDKEIGLFADTLANKLTELGYHVKVGPVLW